MVCASGEQDHEGHCCKKCPKGTHVSSHCQQTTETKCANCSEGYFTEKDNYIDNCLQCRSCDASHHLQVSKNCTTMSDRKCKCMEGFYCTRTTADKDNCETCQSVTRCLPGQGVSVRPKSQNDTKCEPCPAGTFNSNTDYLTPCRNHTSCSDLGRHFLSRGTAETDAKCGDFVSNCHWMIPASLWAGLILTLLLVTIGVVCLKCKRRRKAVITSVNAENFFPPALPPDVIKYPKCSELQTLTHDNRPCAEEDDGALEYEGVSVDVFLEKCASLSIPDTCMSFISEPYRSEPQEDDWPGM